MEIELVGRDRRPLLLASVASFSDWPEKLPREIGPFVAVVAADAADVSIDDITEFAAALLRQGCVYVCTWGPDCERVEDIVDRVRDTDQPVIVTTSHEHEGFAEALWFAVVCARPVEEYEAAYDERGAVLTVVVGRDDWAREAHRLLARPDLLFEEAEASEQRRGRA